VVKKISLLSAGAPQRGIVACIDAYCSDTGFKFYASFSTSPEIKAVMEGIDKNQTSLLHRKRLWCALEIENWLTQTRAFRWVTLKLELLSGQA
jgi:hypothetical protein